MSDPIYTDPRTGRRYRVDPATGRSVWVDQTMPIPQPTRQQPPAQRVLQAPAPAY